MVASDGEQRRDQTPQPDRASFHHEPVMMNEVVEVVENLRPGVFLDATLGAGGHARAVLEANENLRVVGIDRDPMAIEAAKSTLRSFGDRVELHRVRFDRAFEAIGENARKVGLSGFLFDLGVSSPQLDIGARGFSFRNDGPLDMRMDPDAPLSAAEVVNSYEQRELAELLRRNADERHASRIAAAIVVERPIESTARLAAIVAEAVPAAARRTGGHPARRTFQAIRIEVNDELRILGPALNDALDALNPGGRGVIITYHSGEDRIVKDAIRRRTTSKVPAGLPVMESDVEFAVIRPAARKATPEEQTRNPRATSARFRAIEKLIR